MKKTCLVPKCPNNSFNSPNKLFIRIPSNVNTRKKWFEIMNTTNYSIKSTNVFCCEDHFNLEQDAENFMQHKFIGSRLIIKSNVVPHLNMISNRKKSLSHSFLETPHKIKQPNRTKIKDNILPAFEFVNVNSSASHTLSQALSSSVAIENISTPSSIILSTGRSLSSEKISKLPLPNQPTAISLTIEKFQDILVSKHFMISDTMLSSFCGTDQEISETC